MENYGKIVCPGIEAADAYEDGVNQTYFEECMAAGVQAHNSRDNLAALTFRLEAYDIAKSNSIDQGRAARDIGATFDKLGAGYEDDADKWAEMAYDIHKSKFLMASSSSRELSRELSASAMYMAIRSFRKYLRAEKVGLESNSLLKELLGYAHEAWDQIQDAKELADLPIDQEFDQYEINQIRRLIAFEALYGDLDQARILLGKKSVKFVLMSESPRLETSTAGLNTPQELRSKTKAAIGVVAAGTVVGIKSIFRRSKKAHQFAETITSQFVA